MRTICVKNMRQIFRDISEMCVGKFRNFRWHFHMSTEKIPNRDNFRENYGKVCWKKYRKYSLCMLLLQKEMEVYDVTFVWLGHGKE